VHPDTGHVKVVQVEQNVTDHQEGHDKQQPAHLIWARMGTRVGVVPIREKVPIGMPIRQKIKNGECPNSKQYSEKKWQKLE